MLRTLLPAVGSLLVVACDRPPRAPETASVYAGERDTIAHTLLGDELQAPPRIQPMRDQIRRLATPRPEQLGDNLNAHKHQLAELIDAMTADIRRLGGDASPITVLGDSVAHELGGGTGLARGHAGGGLDSVELRRHLDHVERLISTYESMVSQLSATRQR